MSDKRLCVSSLAWNCLQLWPLWTEIWNVRIFTDRENLSPLNSSLDALEHEIALVVILWMWIHHQHLETRQTETQNLGGRSIYEAWEEGVVVERGKSCTELPDSHLTKTTPVTFEINWKPSDIVLISRPSTHVCPFLFLVPEVPAPLIMVVLLFLGLLAIKFHRKKTPSIWVKQILKPLWFLYSKIRDDYFFFNVTACNSIQK